MPERLFTRPILPLGLLRRGRPRARRRARQAAGLTAALFALVAVGVLSPAAAVADDESGSPAPSPSSTATDLEKVAPLVQPSIVYETVKWTGFVYETAPRIR